MKKTRIAFCLVLALLLGLSACTSAGPGQVLDGDGMVLIILQMPLQTLVLWVSRQK